ncbi:MAG: DinB family protein [Candidatus Eisenbacteria bacterium]|nr:DinB family protein [Candidatus Eisenbacteria bacterium]
MAVSEVRDYPSAPALAAAYRQHRDYAWKRLLEFLGSLPVAVVQQPSPGAAGKSIADILRHSLGTIEFWMSVLEGRSHEAFPAEEHSDIPSLARLARLVDGRLQKLLGEADPEWFGRSHSFRFPDGHEEDLVPAWVVLHVLTHEYHHKGQVVSIARSLGYTPPETDFF